MVNSDCQLSLNCLLMLIRLLIRLLVFALSFLSFVFLPSLLFHLFHLFFSSLSSRLRLHSFTRHIFRPCLSFPAKLVQIRPDSLLFSSLLCLFEPCRRSGSCESRHHIVRGYQEHRCKHEECPVTRKRLGHGPTSINRNFLLNPDELRVCYYVRAGPMGGPWGPLGVTTNTTSIRPSYTSHPPLQQQMQLLLH